MNRVRLFAAILIWSVSTGALAQQGAGGESANPNPMTTYERFASLAEAGDPEIQHFLGFMHFYGDGVELNYDASHYWFHQAAEEGDLKSMRNLGLFHSRALPRIPEKFFDPMEANLWFSLAAAGGKDPKLSSLASKYYGQFLAPDTKKLLQETDKRQSGETVYVTFCAGCHGFDGYASYPSAPSFALGEALQRSDSALITSILNGKGAMPSWRNNLSPDLANAAISYIRTILDGNTAGITRAQEQQSSSHQTASPERNLVEIGEQVYMQFCGGCHGFNGVAWYVNSPSFALSERMDKRNEELANSIRNGRGEMPSWEFMLKPEQIDALVLFIRTLSINYENGIASNLRAAPESFFRFRPRGVIGPKPGGRNYLDF